MHGDGDVGGMARRTVKDNVFRAKERKLDLET